jgi:hypothetical protein
MLLFFMVSGSNPPIVVNVVRTMGVKRILAVLFDNIHRLSDFD